MYTMSTSSTDLYHYLGKVMDLDPFKFFLYKRHLLQKSLFHLNDELQYLMSEDLAEEMREDSKVANKLFPSLASHETTKTWMEDKIKLEVQSGTVNIQSYTSATPEDEDIVGTGIHTLAKRLEPGKAIMKINHKILTRLCDAFEIVVEKKPALLLQKLTNKIREKALDGKNPAELFEKDKKLAFFAPLGFKGDEKKVGANPYLRDYLIFTKNETVIPSTKNVDQMFQEFIANKTQYWEKGSFSDISICKVPEKFESLAGIAEAYVPTHLDCQQYPIIQVAAFIQLAALDHKFSPKEDPVTWEFTFSEYKNMGPQEYVQTITHPTKSEKKYEVPKIRYSQKSLKSLFLVSKKEGNIKFTPKWMVSSDKELNTPPTWYDEILAQSTLLMKAEALGGWKEIKQELMAKKMHTNVLFDVLQDMGKVSKLRRIKEKVDNNETVIDTDASTSYKNTLQVTRNDVTEDSMSNFLQELGAKPRPHTFLINVKKLQEGKLGFKSSLTAWKEEESIYFLDILKAVLDTDDWNLVLFHGLSANKKEEKSGFKVSADGKLESWDMFKKANTENTDIVGSGLETLIKRNHLKTNLGVAAGAASFKVNTQLLETLATAFSLPADERKQFEVLENINQELKKKAANGQSPQQLFQEKKLAFFKSMESTTTTEEIKRNPIIRDYLLFTENETKVPTPENIDELLDNFIEKKKEYWKRGSDIYKMTVYTISKDYKNAGGLEEAYVPSPEYPYNISKLAWKKKLATLEQKDKKGSLVRTSLRPQGFSKTIQHTEKEIEYKILKMNYNTTGKEVFRSVFVPLDSKGKEFRIASTRFDDQKESSAEGGILKIIPTIDDDKLAQLCLLEPILQEKQLENPRSIFTKLQDSKVLPKLSLVDDYNTWQGSMWFAGPPMKFTTTPSEAKKTGTVYLTPTGQYKDNRRTRIDLHDDKDLSLKIIENIIEDINKEKKEGGLTFLLPVYRNKTPLEVHTENFITGLESRSKWSTEDRQYVAKVLQSYFNMDFSKK